MDRAFIEKFNSVSEWVRQDDKSELADNSITYHDEEDGLVTMRGPKGAGDYRLKPLQERFSSDTADLAVMKWEYPRYLSLLHAIEGAIKHAYLDDTELTDSAVLIALDQIALKPEAVSKDVIIRQINRELRVALSREDYSRNEVRKAARKILASVKRRKAAAGARGYLHFIMEHVT